MSGDLDLEQRYRRVLRLLPGYYRDKWEEDQMAIIVAGQTWGIPFTEEPLTSGHFEIAVQTKNQARQLQRTLLQPA